MSKDILYIYNFQKDYLFNVLNNVSDEIAYQKQLEGFNSAGWIMGHLCAEGIDVMNKMSIENPCTINWGEIFSYNSKKLESIHELPTLTEAKNDFSKIYDILIDRFLNLTEKEKDSPAPSVLLEDILPNLSSWYIHHLTTHISVHIGNIVVWKKMLGLEINGY